MEVGTLQLLSSVLQYTLRSLCEPDARWVYAIFWRILPRNYPPPKWDSGGTLDRSKENKRNWILVWEDGFCNFSQCLQASCESSTKFGAAIFFKLSHEVYNYGEGVLGKVAADYSHKYIYREGYSTNESHGFSSWSSSVDPQPRAWELQFKTGIKTIAVVAVREGLVQLGSLEKVVEDINFVISIQRKFNYLRSIPGIFAIQRPLLTSSLLCNAMITDSDKFSPQRRSSPFIELDHSEASDFEIKHAASQLVLGKRFCSQTMHQSSPSKAINLGWNAPRASTLIGPMFPSLPSGRGTLFPTMPTINRREYLQSPVGAALEDFKRKVNLEFISSVKPEPIVEAREDLITTSMSLGSAPTTLGTGSGWTIQ